MVENRPRRFRVLVQGECDRNEDGWRGFYVARQTRSLTESDAIEQVLGDIRGDWAGPSARLGTLTYLTAIACWAVGPLDWRKVPAGGHTFYNDDAEAQSEALEMETSVAHTPGAIRRRLRGELSG